MRYPLTHAILCCLALSTALEVSSVVARPAYRALEVAPSSQQGTSEVSRPRSRFDPSGDYYPAETQLTGPFKLIQFDLEVRRRKGKMLVLGEVKEVSRWFRFSSVSISSDLLRFKTRSIKGVSYRFAGHFLARGNFREPGEYSAVLLTGTLEKFVNGRKVAALKGSWVYYPGC